MSDTSAPRYADTIGPVLGAMSQVNTAIGDLGFDRTLYHLVQLRASQINGCGYCVKLHTREAREDGETTDRLDRVIVWRHVDDFTPAERAALAWTEALTVIEQTTDFGSLRADLRVHFSETDIGLLTATIAQINLWNRIQASAH